MDPRSHEHHHNHPHLGGRRGPRRDESFGGPRRGRGRFGGGFGPGGPMGPGQRRGRGDVRIAALLLLLERPMHGYEMIQEITSRSGEAWSPSPGAIYPTIQLLTDEGLITSDDQEGKKVSTLTEEGRRVATEIAATKTAPWEEASNEAGEDAHNLRQSIHHLIVAIKQVGMAGTDAQRQKAVVLLDETRRRIYGLLAADDDA